MNDRIKDAHSLNCDTPSALFFLGGGAEAPPSGPHGHLIHHVSISHIDAPQSVGLLCTSDQPVAETPTWQHTTLTTNIHAPRWDSNPQLSRRAGPQTYALDRAATGADNICSKSTKYTRR